MTVYGTGPAAGVAQTALNAQQAARTKDRERNRRAAEARDLRETLNNHVQAIDEGDEDGNLSQLHIDGQLADRQPPQQVEQSRQEPIDRLDILDSDETPAEPAAGAPRRDLYHHVDLQA